MAADVDGIAANLSAEYREIVVVIDNVPIPGLLLNDKGEQLELFYTLVEAMAEYLTVAVPGFSRKKFYQRVYH